MKIFAATLALMLCACSSIPVVKDWTPLAAADVEINVALGVMSYLKIFEGQVPGAIAVVRTTGLSISAAVIAQADGMLAGNAPAVLTAQAAVAAVVGAAPELKTLLTTKQTVDRGTVTVAADLENLLATESTYVLPAILNATVGSVTTDQLKQDEAALNFAARAL